MLCRFTYKIIKFVIEWKEEGGGGGCLEEGGNKN